MKFTSLIILLFAQHLTLLAHRVIPTHVAPEVDRLIADLHKSYFDGDSLSVLQKSAEIDAITHKLKRKYPMFRGLVAMTQGFYTFDIQKRGEYHSRALSLLQPSDSTLVDTFIGFLYQSMILYYNADRMEEWMPYDDIVRNSLLPKTNHAGFRYALINYANNAFKKEEYIKAKSLANYDLISSEARKYDKPIDQLNLVWDNWLSAKCDLERWKSMPYELKFPDDFQHIGWSLAYQFQDLDQEYLRSLDFKDIYSRLIDDIEELQEVTVLNNMYTNPDCDTTLRRGYYHLYTSIIYDFYSWAKEENKEGQAILALKNYVYNDVVKHEIKPAIASGIKPAITASTLADLYIILATLYKATGNGTYATETATDGMNIIDDVEAYSLEEQILGLVNVLQERAEGYRLSGEYDRAIRDIQFLKKYTPLPTDPEKTNMWERYMALYVEEVYTMLAMDNNNAWDTLKYLLTVLEPMGEGIYDTKHWPQLQYLTAIYKSNKGDWDPDLLAECYMDLSRSGPTFLDIYYPVQLLYFKNLWHAYGELSQTLLNNLLFYTGRKIKYTFFMLSADDRMRLYEQKMSPYFDLYHELLFSGALDTLPELKERVISQSLSIKNSLADGNLISNDLLLRNGKVRLEDAETSREIMRESNLLMMKYRFIGSNVSSLKAMRDRSQSIWLHLLEKCGMDSLAQFTSWQQISDALKPGQVYTETMRYTRWLSDSTAHYGVYVIAPGRQITMFHLCSENELIFQLKNPASSPQTAALNSDENRGSTITIRPGAQSKTYHNDSSDKLSEIIINPLLPFIENKEWFMVQDGILNRIAFGALKTAHGYLMSQNHMHLLSSSQSIRSYEKTMPANGQILLAGGLNYGFETDGNTQRLFKSGNNWNYLKGAEIEIEGLEPMFVQAGHHTNIKKGRELHDSLIYDLSDYNIIHLATHGFYMDTTAAANTYNEFYSRTAMRFEPLYRCGIVVSDANNPEGGKKHETEGCFLGYEIANVDLRKCYLISLSACETGLGDLRNNLGVDGLSRALKIAGAQNLLISLWKVPDQPTALFMQQFYTHLFSGKSPSEALRLTQNAMSQTHPVSDWAAFVLVN